MTLREYLLENPYSNIALMWFDEKQRLQCKEYGLNEEDIILKSIDAYSNDLGFSVIESAINTEAESNIILASFGPKPSAIAVYKSYMQHPEIALCYLPCNEYNQQYCQGIGDSVSYTLTFPTEEEV